MVRVAAYCRVSTDKDDQLNSLESQKRYFTEYINRNSKWYLVNVYADEGISGTSTKKRKAFNNMIRDAELNLIDLIITKEISRFARNTLDSIYYTRKLKELGIGVVFLNDNINTFDSDSELRLTIMSSIAQEESRKTSERVLWGQKRAMERGVVFGAPLLGYSVEDGKITIVNEEADTIRQIFYKFLNEKKGLNTIAKELEFEGHLTKSKQRKWSASYISRLLKNEKYIGDLVQRKSYTTNYLTHKSKKNNGEQDFIIIKNNHDAIIDRLTFEKTQVELKNRVCLLNENTKYTNRYAFSGKLICGLCNAHYVSRNKNIKGKKTIKRWQCGTAFKYGSKKNTTGSESIGCDSRLIRDELLQNVFNSALYDIFDNKDDIISDITKILNKITNSNKNDDDEKQILIEIEKIKKQKNQLLDLYLENTISKNDLKSKLDQLEERNISLNNLIKRNNEKKTILNNQSETISIIKEIVAKIVTVETFSEEVCKELLDKIIIFNKENYKVYIKGLPIPLTPFSSPSPNNVPIA